jgi:hypothetical protein
MLGASIHRCRNRSERRLRPRLRWILRAGGAPLPCGSFLRRRPESSRFHARTHARNCADSSQPGTPTHRLKDSHRGCLPSMPGVHEAADGRPFAPSTGPRTVTGHPGDVRTSPARALRAVPTRDRSPPRAAPAPDRFRRSRRPRCILGPRVQRSDLGAPGLSDRRRPRHHMLSSASPPPSRQATPLLPGETHLCR